MAKHELAIKAKLFFTLYLPGMIYSFSFDSQFINYPWHAIQGCRKWSHLAPTELLRQIQHEKNPSKHHTLNALYMSSELIPPTVNDRHGNLFMSMIQHEMTSCKM